MRIRTSHFVLALLLCLVLPAKGQADDALIPADPADVVVNGGFELGFAHWYAGGAVGAGALSSTAHRGLQSYQVDTRSTGRGSYLWQPLSTGEDSFVLTTFVNRHAGDSTIELVRDWSGYTGQANFVTEVNFARAPSGRIRLRAWNTLVETDRLWPRGWHKLTVVANARLARQQFYLDDRLLATIQASDVFSSEHLILGDVAGPGTRALYQFDDVSLLRVASPAPASGHIGGTLFMDASGDGMQDDDEVGLADVFVTLVAVNESAPGATVATAITDVSGHYFFANAPAGRYYVHAQLLPDQLAGAALTTAGNPLGPLTLDDGDMLLDAPIGFGPQCATVRGAVGGRVWLDRDGSQSQEAEEPGLSGAVVCAEPLSHASGRCTTTGPQGYYLFCLPPGAYLLAPQATDGPPLAGMTATTPNFFLPVAVEPGTGWLAGHFGYR